MKERRYKMHCMNGKEYTIDEEDLKKLNENSDKMLVKMKQVIVHPSSIVSIEPFFVPYVRKAIDHTSTSMTILDPERPKALEDLFDDTVLKLTAPKDEHN